MSQKTLLQDSNYNWDTDKMLDAYKEAADVMNIYSEIMIIAMNG